MNSDDQRIDIESSIRPVSTKCFDKYYAENQFDFPNLYVNGKNHVWTQDPVNTRVELQNQLLIRRHFDK